MDNNTAKIIIRARLEKFTKWEIRKILRVAAVKGFDDVIELLMESPNFNKIPIKYIEEAFFISA